MKRLICWVVGHRYRVKQVFSADSRRVCCDRCGGDWAMNDRVRVIVPWSAEFEQFYRENGHLLKEQTNVG
jgi:predicted  nucleic acid-binding Zn ribbon protein